MRDRANWLGRAAVLAAAVMSLAAGLLVGAPQASAATVKPGAPTGVAALAADQGAVVSWTAPSSDGGSPVTGYVITASPGGATAHTAAVTSFLVGGLTNGTAYTFTVAAVNASGKGPASSPSAAVTPQPAMVPGAARSVAAVAGFEQAAVSWAAPKSDGGAPVTGYQITTSPPASAVTVAGSARSAVVAGLADGTAYTVRVAAVNSVGTGKAVASGSVTPQVTAPGAPVGVTAAPATVGVKVGWQPPASDGGSAVTGYVVAVTGTATTVTAAATARSVTLTGLTAGTSYTFTVAAANAQGQGPAATSTPATAGATVAAQTVVLSKASLATLTQVGTDGSLVFTSPTGQVKGLVAGDVVAAGVSAATPGGLLAQVTSMTPAGTTVTVATTPASLDQALSAGGFGASTALTSGQVTAFSPARRGVRLLPADRVPASAAPGSIGVSVDVDLYTDNHDAQVTVKGSLTLTPHLSFAASISCCVHTSSQFTGTVTATDSLALSAQLSHDISGGIDLGTFTFAPITVTVAGVPVVIVPDLSLKLAANGTVSIGTITAGSTLTVGANVTTSDATVTATPVYQLTNSFTPPTVAEPFSAAIGPQAELGTHIDGLPGPFLTDTLWLPKLTVDPAGDPWWTLGGENELTLNYELSLLHHDFVSYSKTLSDIKFLVSHSLDPYQDVTITPSPATAAPGGQLQLHAQVAGVTNQAVTWKAPTGGGTITTGGLYKAPTTPGTYVVTATQPASGLKPAATGLIGISVGHQPPGPPTSPAATSASYGTATITWTPPADTGGGTITGYTVTAAPGGQTGQAPGTATSATIGGLTPGASYTFTVTATSDGGTSVPSPATSPVVIDNIGGSAGWTASEAPLPANAAADPSVDFTSVVCPGATCVAAGFYNDSAGNQQGLLETGSGTSWAAAESPLPANAGTNPTVYVNSVACESTSECVIAGSYEDAAGAEHGLLVTGFGTSWRAIETPLPVKASTVAYSFLNSVTCPSSSTCFAVGSYVDSQNFSHTLLLTGSRTSWTAAHAPLPANAGTSDSGLRSVACSSVSTCMIIGYYTDKSGGDQGLLLSRSGTSWTPVQAPKVANESTGLQIDSQTVCVSSTCLAAGNYYDTSDNLQLSLLSGYGSSWTVTEAPLPASALYNPGLSSAVCTAASSCTAVGGYFDSPGGWYHGLVISGAGSAWTATEAPIPSNGEFNGGGGIGLTSSVTCPSALQCTAVGFYNGASGSTVHGLLLEGHGSSWKATEAPLPPQGTYGDLTSVTCPSISSCVAVGSYTNPSGSGQGLILTKSG